MQFTRKQVVGQLAVVVRVGLVVLALAVEVVKLNPTVSVQARRHDDDATQSGVLQM